MSANPLNPASGGPGGGRPNPANWPNPANFPQVSAAVSRAQVAGEKTNPLTGGLTGGQP